MPPKEYRIICDWCGKYGIAEEYPSEYAEPGIQAKVECLGGSSSNKICYLDTFQVCLDSEKNKRANREIPGDGPLYEAHHYGEDDGKP